MSEKPVIPKPDVKPPARKPHTVPDPFAKAKELDPYEQLKEGENK